MRFLSLFTFFLVCGCATKTPGASYQALKSYQSGLEFGHRGEIKEAVDQLEESVRSDPSFSEAWFNLAIGYEKLHEYDHALYAYDRAVQTDGNFLEARMGLADRLYEKGMMERALTEYLTILGKDGNIAQAHVRAGAIYAKLNQPTNAREHMKAATRLSPFAYEAFHWLGKDAVARRQWNEGWDYLMKAYTAGMDQQEIWQSIIEFLMSQRRSGSAREWIAKAKAQFPSATWIHSYQTRMKKGSAK